MHFRFTWLKSDRAFTLLSSHIHTRTHTNFTLHVHDWVSEMYARFWLELLLKSLWFVVFALIFLWIGYIDARAHCTRSQSNTRCVNNIVYKKNEHTSWFSKERRDREKKHKLFRPEEGDFDWACACVCLHMIVLCHLLSFSLFVFLRHLLASWFIQTRFLPPYRPNVHMR